MTSFLIIQTAFAGDLILTLPLAQELRRLHPAARIDVVCIPQTATLLRGHPAFDTVIVYDKRGGTDRFLDIARRLRVHRYHTVISPHRSFRSALLARATGAQMRIAFDRAAGALLYTHRVEYRDDAHEVERNLALLTPLTADVDGTQRPRLYPGESDTAAAAAIVATLHPFARYAVIAPGSVWATKRYPVEGFRAVAEALPEDCGIVLIGGNEDRELCDRVASPLSPDRVRNTAGSVSFLASAALIQQAAVLISNDSAPVHIASAMGTPVVEVYGATVPRFGFTPFGVPSRIVELDGLSCRPCGIHGGDACPIETFNCMRDLSPQRVARAAIDIMRSGR
jgi:heptosyltransferase II